MAGAGDAAVAAFDEMAIASIQILYERRRLGRWRDENRRNGDCIKSKELQDPSASSQRFARNSGISTFTPNCGVCEIL